MKPPGDAPRARRRPAHVLVRGGTIASALLVIAIALVTAALRHESHDAPPASATPSSAPPAGQSLLDQVPTDGGLVPARWPSATVLTKAVTLDTAPAPGFVNVHVPPIGATFASAFGINPERFAGLASGPFRFSVAVLTARGKEDRGERKLLLEEQIDPAHEPTDRKWFPVSVDLDRYAGQDVLLVLSVSTAHLVDAPGDLAGWADPRLVPRTPPTAEP